MTVGPDVVDRTREAADLLDRADRDGVVELVVLDDDEECVLGDGRWAMSDADAWRRWCALGQEERSERAAAVLTSLLTRQLAAPTGQGAELALSPSLGFVQAARSRPGFLVCVLAAGADDQAVPAPLGYGLVEAGRHVRAVVLELRDEGVHDYRLLSPDRAAAAVTRWATQTARAGHALDAAGPRSSVVVEVLRHREGERLEAAAVTLSATDTGMVASTLFFGGRRVERQDAALAADHLREILEQAADLEDGRRG